jgi:hypothetical protein
VCISEGYGDWNLGQMEHRWEWGRLSTKGAGQRKIQGQDPAVLLHGTAVLRAKHGAGHC